jgi:two-component system, cell cycle sensor histidine kinase and response regulator CckA
MRDVLLSEGYRVLEASDGIEALSVAERGEEIDLLLCDVVMPYLSGGELAARLLRERPGLQVLYTSGYPDDTVVQRGVSSVAVAFLPKPFSVDALLWKVRAILDGALQER